MSKNNKFKQRHDIIITGEWDGQPIWRRKTAQDLMQEAFTEMEKNKPKKQLPKKD